jgi:hypothetical protein
MERCEEREEKRYEILLFLFLHNNSIGLPNGVFPKINMRINSNIGKM